MENLTNKQLDKREEIWRKGYLNLLTAIGESGKYDEIIKAKGVIRELADESRKVPLFNMPNSREKYITLKEQICKEFPDKNKRVEVAVYHLFTKIANAPFQIMADGAVRLITPMIDDFIKDTEKKSRDFASAGCVK